MKPQSPGVQLPVHSRAPEPAFMKMPPFLLAAALLFWGWQTGFLMAGTLMALVLECARWVTWRWELTDDDYNRIWTFCVLLLLASGIYAFTSNGTASEVSRVFRDPSFLARSNVGTATSQAAADWLRWLPMIFFLFVVAERFSSRQGIPLEVVSPMLRWRWRRARRAGRPLPPTQTVRGLYAYWGLCVFAACTTLDQGYVFLGAVRAAVMGAMGSAGQAVFDSGMDGGAGRGHWARVCGPAWYRRIGALD